MFNQEDVLVRSIAFIITASTVSWPVPTNIHLVLSNKHLERRNEPPTSESVRFGIEHCNCIKITFNEIYNIKLKVQCHTARLKSYT